MSAPDEDLLSLLAYRMYAISIGRLALRHHMSWDKTPSMMICFDGTPVIEGEATGFTNAAIESAIIHCRAILEFLGLCSTKTSHITEITKRTRDDDLGIEKISGLAKVTKDLAVAGISANPTDAEKALSLILHAANKGLAHTTTSFDRDSAEAHLYKIAFEGIQDLLISCFYTPLGITPPEHQLSWRHRSAPKPEL